MAYRVAVGLSLTLFGLTTGCAGAARADLATAAQADSTRAFVLFRGPELVQVDHLRLLGDSVFGLRLREHPNAPQIPVVLAVGEVDSITVAHPDRAGLAAFAVPIAVVVGLIVLLRASWGSD